MAASASETFDHVMARYVDAAQAWAQALEAVDRQRADAAKAARQAAAVTLQELGRSQAILVLLDDANLAVHCCAAMDALRLDPARGEAVLQDLVDGPPSPARMMAIMNLGQRRLDRQSEAEKRRRAMLEDIMASAEIDSFKHTPEMWELLDRACLGGMDDAQFRREVLAMVNRES